MRSTPTRASTLVLGAVALIVVMISTIVPLTGLPVAQATAVCTTDFYPDASTAKANFGADCGQPFAETPAHSCHWDPAGWYCQGPGIATSQTVTTSPPTTSFPPLATPTPTTTSAVTTTSASTPAPAATPPHESASASVTAQRCRTRLYDTAPLAKTNFSTDCGSAFQETEAFACHWAPGGWYCEGPGLAPALSSTPAPLTLESPRSIAVVRDEDRTVGLTWTTDDSSERVHGWAISRDGHHIATVTTGSWVDRTAVPGRTHTYRVAAIGQSGSSPESPHVVAPSVAAPELLMVGSDGSRPNGAAVMLAANAVLEFESVDLTGLATEFAESPREWIENFPKLRAQAVRLLATMLFGNPSYESAMDTFRNDTQALLDAQGSRYTLPMRRPRGDAIRTGDQALIAAARALRDFEDLNGRNPSDAEAQAAIERALRSEGVAAGPTDHDPNGECRTSLDCHVEPAPCANCLAGNFTGGIQGGPDDLANTSDLDGDGFVDMFDDDRDGDGVPNDQDDFPDDPTRHDEDDRPTTPTPTQTPNTVTDPHSMCGGDDASPGAGC